MAELTLEEMAQRIAAERANLENAEAEAERLREPYEAADGRARRLAESVKRMEAGMHAVKRAHLIRRAVTEAGIETTLDPIILIPDRIGGRPERYELVAVGREGTGLYLSTGKYRSSVKTYARPVTEGEEFDERDQYLAAAAAEMAELRARDLERGYRSGGRGDFDRFSRRVHGTDKLVTWEARGSGDFGAGSGSLKPKPPPEGGRWRWLKVREQEALAA